jgi:DNA-directed RNA polymerase specialized sigma24 family protein
MAVTQVLHHGWSGPAGIDLRMPLTFDDFFGLERDRLYGSLCRIVGDREEAEEVARRAFTTVWDRWDRVQDAHDPAGYLHRVATRMVLRRRRRKEALRLFPQAIERADDVSAGVPSNRDEPAARFGVDDIGRLHRRRRRRETTLSLAVALVVVAVGIVGSLRSRPPEPRVPLVQGTRSAVVDLRRIVLGEHATPLRAGFEGRDAGAAALWAGLPAGDANAWVTAGFVRAARTSFERLGEPPLHDASVETWVAEYDSPGAARVALGVFLDSARFDEGLVEPRPVALRAADEGNRYVDRAIPRNVVYLWRHGRLLLRVRSEGNFPPSDVHGIAVTMDARAAAAT